MIEGKRAKIDDLTLLKCLGKGSFGEVFLTTKEGSNELFATKKMDKEYADSPKVSKYLKNEIAILKELKHKNVIKLEEVKTTKNHYYLVMEYCNGGSLSDCLNEYQEKYGKPFSEEIVQYLMRQIVEGIKYIHNKNIIHRDLKLDNILVNFHLDADRKNLNMMKAEVKIIDFGFSIHIKKNDLCYSTLGSPINMDPSILKKLADQRTGQNDGKMVGYDQKADIWSIGTLCYEMLIGKSAFDSETLGELVQKVENGSYKIPTHLSKELISFLNGMLQYNAEKRLNANELARHHFLTKNIKDLEPIDVQKVSNKIKNNNLNVNIKRNNTIWSIFNEEDEKKLINIPGNYLSETPIKEEEEEKEDSFNQMTHFENKRRNTEKIVPHIEKNNYFNNYPQEFNNPHEIIKTNTQKYTGYGTGFHGIGEYGNNNNRGFGFPHYPLQIPACKPHFPHPMPLVVPPSIHVAENDDNKNEIYTMGEKSGPIMNICTFGVPSPGENINSESTYSFSSGVFQPDISMDSKYCSKENAHGYGYGYGYGN